MICENCGEEFDPLEGLENVPDQLVESFVERRKYCSKRCKDHAVFTEWYAQPHNARSVAARVVKQRATKKAMPK